MINNDLDKPSIYVLTNTSQELILNEILAGIEEEGIPYELINSDLKTDSLNRCAHAAAEESKIGIAIGVLNSRIVLHNNKLREEKPLIDICLNNYDKERARALGANAARLYKVMPFKDIEGVDAELIEKVTLAVISALKQLNIKLI